MIKEAIILAGGLGTRLRSAVPDLPKCMAPVSGKPFIDYVLAYLSGEKIDHFILSLGYRSEVIQQHIEKHFGGWNISFSIEDEPLGTGGAIVKACKLVKNKNAVITNGDTLYKANLKNATAFMESNDPECLLFLKPVENIDRYGVVQIDDKQQIFSFQEKGFYQKGLINGGIYFLDVLSFLKNSFPPKFSFEKEYLETHINRQKIFGILDDAYFIDIGVPKDYQKAQKELSLPESKV